jgi:hypothetical protein
VRRALPSAQVSVEIEKPGRDGLLELAATADVVFYSRSWAEVYHKTQPVARKWMLRYADGITCCRTAGTRLPKHV